MVRILIVLVAMLLLGTSPYYNNIKEGMEYIDFVKRKVQLHHEIENAIKEMMMEKGVTEIDLLKDEESFDAGWLIRSIGDTNALEEVLVANIKVENNTLYYKGKTTCETDEDWQLLDVSDNVLLGSIDTVYDAVFQRIKSNF